MHAVILSGYSEFEYAPKAIQLGVDDYLLKPIGADDVILLLDQINSRMRKEEESQKVKPESLLRDILLCDQEERYHYYSRLKELSHFEQSGIYCAFLGDNGCAAPQCKSQYTEVFQHMAARYNPTAIYQISMGARPQTIYLINETVPWDTVKRTFERKLSGMDKEKSGIWTGTSFTQIDDFHSIVELLQKRLNYG